VEQERVARKKEKRIRWQVRREQRDKEFWLREQQGLSPPGDIRRLVVRRGGGERWGTNSPREVGAFAPLAQSRGGGRGDSA
jgi:hypothetical protein